MQAETNESYLIFTIHKRLYAIKNTNVQEIMHSAKIHPLPFVPDYIEGMVNCRGLPYTVVNLLKMEKEEDCEIPEPTVLVFRREDDQISLHISGMFPVYFLCFPCLFQVCFLIFPCIFQVCFNL